MKTKTMIAMALLTAGLGIGALGTPVSASSWHEGLPSILRHTKWYQAKHPSYKLTFGSQSFAFWGPTGGARFGLPENNVKYKAVKRHLYLVYAHDRWGSFSGRYFKYTNRHKLIQYGYSKGYTSGTIVFHRYY